MSSRGISMMGSSLTLGPGHGKSVIVAYFTGEGGRFSRGVGMGLQIAIFHVLSAVVVVVVTDIAVKSVTGSGLSDFGLVRKISYGAIICIGILMLWSAVKTWRHRSRHSHHEHHHQDQQ